MQLITSRAYPLALQLTEPVGAWCSAGSGKHCFDKASRYGGAYSQECPPVGENGSALAVTAPVEPGQRAGILSDVSSPSPKPKRLLLPKRPISTTGDLFSESLSLSASSSSKKRQTAVLALALDALLSGPVGDSGGSFCSAPDDRSIVA